MLLPRSSCVKMIEEQSIKKQNYAGLGCKTIQLVRTLIEVVMKFLLARVCREELRPSLNWKREACAQECGAQKRDPKIHSSFSSSNAKIKGDRVKCVELKFARTVFTVLRLPAGFNVIRQLS